MTMRTNCILLLVILLGAFPLNRVHADESGSIILYTPYTKIFVTQVTVRICLMANI